MFRKTPAILALSLALIAVFVLTGCSPLVQIITNVENPPTPVGPAPSGEVDNPDIFADPAVFQEALLKALNSGDTAKLQNWMTEPFFAGTWRVEQSEISRQAAVKLLANQMGAQKSLALVEGVDLKALMGGKDPLSIPRSDSGVMFTYLVSGWGQDGRDEAILFITRQADDNLKWYGWLTIQGGMSGSRLGGTQPYQNEANGYSLYVPKNYQVNDTTATNTDILAPVEAEPGDERAAAFVFVEPANGRTAEQIVEDIKSDPASGFNIHVDAKMVIEGEPALTVKGIAAQCPNRMLFIVHNDTLYRVMFWSDNPQAKSYPQMQDLYAMVVNTLHFTK